MIYRMRIYRAVEDNIEVFNQFFNERLLPVQLKHGARIVGRWQTTDSRIVAVWEYDDQASYESIQAQVRVDSDSIAAQDYRKSLPQMAYEQEEIFMTDTILGNPPT
jgi:hypothetical protein